MGVLSLGIMGGTDIRIIADGSDEEAAVEGLVSLVKSGFTENRLSIKRIKRKDILNIVGATVGRLIFCFLYELF